MDIKKSELPQGCCKNVGRSDRGSQETGFVACNQQAIAWYLHNDDICSYCPEHNTPCGDPIEYEE